MLLVASVALQQIDRAGINVMLLLQSLQSINAEKYCRRSLSSEMLSLLTVGFAPDIRRLSDVILGIGLIAQSQHDRRIEFEYDQILRIWCLI